MRVVAAAGGGMALDTVTVIGAEVVVLPAASRARAVSVCAPLLEVLVFQATSYGAVVSSPPTWVPSTKNLTPDTLTLSDAVAAIVTPPESVAPSAGDVMAAVGGVESAGPATPDVTSNASTTT